MSKETNRETHNEILQKNEPVLREVAKSVPPEDIRSEYVQKILADMFRILEKQKDGVALAAPQIGVNLRIFVVSEKAYETDEEDEGQKSAPRKKPKTCRTVFINPEITKVSKKRRWLEEGCLSVRWLYGKAHRNEKATVKAYDKHGEKFTHGASDLLAQIFQHETDHLNGVLFIDHAKNVHEISDEEKQKIDEG